MLYASSTAAMSLTWLRLVHTPDVSGLRSSCTESTGISRTRATMLLISAVKPYSPMNQARLYYGNSLGAALGMVGLGRVPLFSFPNR